MKTRPHEPPMPEALAYFITWTTYGSWLPGDERGWVLPGKGIQPPDPVRKKRAAARMTEEVCIFDNEQRHLVEKTITDHCRIRGWELHAVNCRTNHVHVVVTADRDPDTVREQFMAWCTTKLKKLQATRMGMTDKEPTRLRQNWWTEGGSGYFLNDPAGLEEAIRYVRDRQ
jgi:REP element-mobilizing transposase RayT